MQTTTNLGLKKPDKNEFVDISILNYNSDVIDGAVTAKVDSSNGDISETVVGSLDAVGDKFPIPSAGDKIKQFLGKVLTFLRNIKPLEADVTYYVSTAGSDTMGDGTNGNPFKTVQYAINSFPKDLGGHFATIILADGVYDTVNIVGFYNGELQLQSTSTTAINSNTRVSTVSIQYCVAKVSIFGIKCLDNSSAASVMVRDCRHVYLAYLSITDISSNRGIYAYETQLLRVTGCDITGKAEGIRFNNTCGHVTNCTGASNTISLISAGASTVHIVGTIPGGTTARSYENGGAFFETNGTQITGPFLSGLTCTWGTIGGGYIRHGTSSNGVAMITVQIRIAVTTALTSGTDYIISGFPAATTDIACSTSNITITSNCYINSSGQLRFRPNSTVATGTAIAFNVTYLATS